MYVFFIFLIEILIAIFFKHIDSEGISLIFIFVNIFVAYQLITKNFSARLCNVVFIGFILRVLLSLIDYYKVFPVLHSGGDSEAFHNNAVAMYLYDTFDSVTRTNYEYFIGGIYRLIGPQRLFLLNINTFYGLGSIIFLYKTISMFRLDQKVIKRIVLLVSFFPHSIIFSSILLREAWVNFFVTVSIYYFVQWFRSTNITKLIQSFGFLLIGALMHSGVICWHLATLLHLLLIQRVRKK